MKILNYFMIAALSLFVFASCDDPNQPDNPKEPDTEETPDNPENPEDPENPDNPTPPKEDEEIPETTYKMESLFCDYNYWGHFMDYPGETDNVVLLMGTAEHEGFWVTGEGELLVLSLYLPGAEDPEDVSVMAGTYTWDNDNTFGEMTIAEMESNMPYYEEDKTYPGYYTSYETTYFSDAELTIKEVDGGYKVTALLTYENGETMYVSYEGELNFDNKYSKAGWPEIEEDKNFICGYGEVSYYGNASYVLDIMSGGDPWVDMSWSNRDRIQMEMTLPEDDATGITAGTYTIGKEVFIGEYVYLSDQSYITGSRYFYFDGATMEQVVGYLVGGTVTIERVKATAEGEADQYKIVVDAVDANAYMVQTTYEGPLNLVDYTDNSQN